MAKRRIAFSLPRAARPLPLAVAALALANAAVFALELGVLAARGESALGELFETWGLVPRELLRGFGPGVAMRERVWLTPLTAMFLHANAAHILFNMMALWSIGQTVERMYGRWRFLAIYLLGGLLGSAFSVMLGGGSSVGASGAVFAIFGAEFAAGGAFHFDVGLYAPLTGGLIVRYRGRLAAHGEQCLP